MRDGSRRVDVPYLWPRTLKVPRRPPRLIYLDLNHWITLAKAESGHPEGKDYREILRWCCDAVDRGDAVFPISDTIYMEIAKIGQYRQRRDLRMTIERVSRFFVITSRDVIATHEVEALLDEVAGPNPQPINTMNYLDWGLARAFGMVGGFRIRSKDGDDLTADVRASHPEGPEAFDAILAQATMSLNRRVIEGPSPEEEPEMRARGCPEACSKCQSAERNRRSNRSNGSTTIQLGDGDESGTSLPRVRSCSSSRTPCRGASTNAVPPSPTSFRSQEQPGAGWTRYPVSTSR